MKKSISITCLCVVLLFNYCTDKSNQVITEGQTVKLSKAKLADKIKGAWAGQVIGVCYGAPTEFQFQSTFIPDYYPHKFDTAQIRQYFNNDDIYMDLTWVNVFEKYGMDAPVDTFAVAFANAGYELWHANLTGRFNVLSGMMPPQSGNWINNPHADDIDFQIESDFAGIMNPCMINSTAEVCDKIGHIMNYGDGWYGGVYLASMYSLAYYSDDIEFIVNEALKEIPEQSTYHQCIADVIKWHKRFPNNWKQTWFELQKKWGEDIGCPDGVFTTVNIDAKMNSAEVVMGLLYGGGDFEKTIDIAMRCGDDSDCNPSSAGGILGAVKGYSNIPEKFMKPYLKIENRKLDYVNVSMKEAYAMSIKHALKMIEKNGGKVNGDVVEIKLQKPSPVRLEQAFTGYYPADRISYVNTLDKQKPEISFDFTGNGIVIRGNVANDKTKFSSNDLKIAELYIDDKPVSTLSFVKNGKVRRNDMFWIYGLQDAKHHATIRLVNSQDALQLKLWDMVVYTSTKKSL